MAEAESLSPTMSEMPACEQEASPSLRPVLRRSSTDNILVCQQLAIASTIEQSLHTIMPSISEMLERTEQRLIKEIRTLKHDVLVRAAIASDADVRPGNSSSSVDSGPISGLHANATSSKEVAGYGIHEPKRESFCKAKRGVMARRHSVNEAGGALNLMAQSGNPPNTGQKHNAVLPSLSKTPLNSKIPALPPLFTSSRKQSDVSIMASELGTQGGTRRGSKSSHVSQMLPMPTPRRHSKMSNFSDLRGPFGKMSSEATGIAVENPSDVAAPKKHLSLEKLERVNDRFLIHDSKLTKPSAHGQYVAEHGDDQFDSPSYVSQSSNNPHEDYNVAAETVEDPRRPSFCSGLTDCVSRNPDTEENKEPPPPLQRRRERATSLLPTFAQLTQAVRVHAANALPSTTEERIGKQPSRNSVSSLANLRELRHDELIANARDSETTDISATRTDQILQCAPFWLCMSGILPWPKLDGYHSISRWCTRLTRLIAVLLIAAIIVAYGREAVTKHSEGTLAQTCDAAVCMQDTFLPVLALGVGCLLAFFVCMFSEQVVGAPDATLTMCVLTADVLDLWNTQTRHDMVKLLLSWLCMVGSGIYASFGWEVDGKLAAMHLTVFAFMTNVFLAFSFSILYICRGVFLVLDDFCAKIVEEGDCAHAVDDWNTLQAIMRRLCNPVARTYISLLTSSLAAMFLPAIFNTDNLVGMLPGTFALVVLLWLSLFIGGVTSKCDRVPAFINTLDFGESFDKKRAYVVNYIINSRAGFYMFDVRVTGEMVAKCAYAGSVLAAAYVIRASSIS